MSANITFETKMSLSQNFRTAFKQILACIFLSVRPKPLVTLHYEIPWSLYTTVHVRSSRTGSVSIVKMRPENLMTKGQLLFFPWHTVPLCVFLLL